MKNWVIGLLSVLLFLAVLRGLSLQEGNRSLEAVIVHQKDSVRLWKDKYDKNHAEINILQLDRDTFKDLYAQEVAKSFDVKPKQLESVTTITTKTEKVVAVPLVDNKFSFREPWIQLNGSVSGTTLHLNYQHTDSITLITKHKRRIFKPDLYTVHAISHNPATSFTQLDRVEIRERPKRFGIGAGVYYTPAGLQIGLGIQYNIIRF